MDKAKVGVESRVESGDDWDRGEWWVAMETTVFEQR